MISLFRFLLLRFLLLAAVLVVGVGDVKSLELKDDSWLKEIEKSIATFESKERFYLRHAVNYREQQFKEIYKDHPYHFGKRAYVLLSRLYSFVGDYTAGTLYPFTNVYTDRLAYFENIFLDRLKVPGGTISIEDCSVNNLKVSEVISLFPPTINRCRIAEAVIECESVYAMYSDATLMVDSSKIEELTFYNNTVKKRAIDKGVPFSVFSGRLGVDATTMYTMNLAHRFSEVRSFEFKSDTIGMLHIYAMKDTSSKILPAAEIGMKDCLIDTLILDGAIGTLIKFIERGPNIIKNIILDRQERFEPDTFFDLGVFIQNEKRNEENCVLHFSYPINRNVVFNYKFHELNRASVDSCFKKDPDATHFMFQNLLAMQDKYGYVGGKEKLQIQYNNLCLEGSWTFELFFSKWWWNYGYDKGRIFWWTGGLFLLFFFVNHWNHKYLVNEVYSIKALEPLFKMSYYESLKGPHRLERPFLGALFYSALIFFGVKLDVSAFKINHSGKNIFFVVYLYTFYVIGIVCLVFIANYILLK